MNASCSAHRRRPHHRPHLSHHHLVRIPFRFTTTTAITTRSLTTSATSSTCARSTRRARPTQHIRGVYPGPAQYIRGVRAQHACLPTHHWRNYLHAHLSVLTTGERSELAMDAAVVSAALRPALRGGQRRRREPSASSAQLGLTSSIHGAHDLDATRQRSYVDANIETTHRTRAPLAPWGTSDAYMIRPVQWCWRALQAMDARCPRGPTYL